MAWREQGFGPDHVAALALQLGWRPGAVIKALNRHWGLGIGEAKQLTDRHLDAPSKAAVDYLRLQAALVAQMPVQTSDSELRAFEEETGWNRKLWALVRAGRFDDAHQAIGRFNSVSMSFEPLAPVEARALVVQEIETWPMPMRVIDEATTDQSFGWAFFCQSVAYLDSGDWRDMAVGHGAFLVDKWTGVLWATGSAMPTDHYVANYIATGDPHGASDDPARW